MKGFAARMVRAVLPLAAFAFTCASAAAQGAFRRRDHEACGREPGFGNAVLLGDDGDRPGQSDARQGDEGRRRRREESFVEFTNPEDKGVRYLKTDKNLWMYFPVEQETVKISGHLLKEGMMGSRRFL